MALGQRLGREPSRAELAAELGEPVEKIQLLQEAATMTASLDAPMAGHEELSLAEVVQDVGAEDPISRAEHASLRDLIDRALEALGHRSRGGAREGGGVVQHDPAEEGLHRTLQHALVPTRIVTAASNQTKTPSGRNAETIQLGASTISLILRSTVTLHRM